MRTRSGTRAGRTAILALAAVGMALAGCTSSTPSKTDTTSASAPTSAATSATSAPSETTGPTTPATGTSTAATASGVGACLTSQLTTTLGPGSGGGAGHDYPVVVLTNKGTTACTVTGYPGVSFVGDGNGTQLGAAATREAAGVPVTTLTLAPGAAAHAQLSIALAGNYDAATCKPKPADGLRIYPPGETHSTFVATTTYTACQDASVVLLTIRPLQAGAA